MRKIVVFGASGYVGSVLVPYLLQHGHEVTAVDLAPNSAALRDDACRYPRLRIVKADCGDIKLLMREAAEADVIYWLVGLTGNKPEELMREINVELSAKMALAALTSRVGDQVIVYANTNAGYIPHGMFAHENCEMIGRTPYSRTKIEAEKILMDSGRCVSFRLAAVYGPAPIIRWETLLNHMVKAAVGGVGVYKVYQPTAMRDVIFTSDLAEQLYLPVLTDLRGEIFNTISQSYSKQIYLDSVQRQLPDFQYEICDGEDIEKRDFVSVGAKLSAVYEKLYGGKIKLTPLSQGIYATIQAARLEQ